MLSSLLGVMVVHIPGPVYLSSRLDGHAWSFAVGDLNCPDSHLLKLKISIFLQNLLATHCHSDLCCSLCTIVLFLSAPLHVLTGNAA